ncbi:MAG TPA: DMT family transporter [Xanthobacteraceae bacterium]|nr:DMT family transporter [Xanthobacteraceae bacterium]
MLVALSFAWGLTWPAMRIALDEVPPFSMRVVTLALGAAALFIVVALQGRPFSPGGPKNCAHLIVSGILNILSFSLLSVIAMMFTATGRVAMLAYTMPIWAALFAWLVLGERLTRARIVALVLCTAGMAILVYPLAQSGALIGVLIALTIAVSWAAGTVYVKWVRITGDPIANAAWQIVIAFVVVVLCLPFAEGTLHLSQASALAVFAMIFAGLVGSALAYFLWFGIIGRISAMTASLGVLSAPVIGVVSTAILLGEIPTVADVIGYVLIFAASVCVLLPSRG